STSTKRFKLTGVAAANNTLSTMRSSRPMLASPAGVSSNSAGWLSWSVSSSLTSSILRSLLGHRSQRAVLVEGVDVHRPGVGHRKLDHDASIMRFLAGAHGAHLHEFEQRQERDDHVDARRLVVEQALEVDLARHAQRL